MPSDYEQRALCEVEQRIAAEDPGFARTFATHQERLARNDHRRDDDRLGDHRLGDAISLTVAVVLAVAMVMAGLWTGAAAMAIATGLVWVLWRTADLWLNPDGTGGSPL